MDRPEREGSEFVVADAGAVRVRFKRRDDFEDDYRWRRDPETARLDGNSVLALPFDAYVRLVERELLFGDPNRMSFSIDSADGRHIGNIMLYNISGGRDAAEFGISIGESDGRGLGYGPAATVAFLRYAWAALPFRRIDLHTFDWNERARKSFERSGFSETGRMLRGEETLIRMEARREWWLLWDSEGRFEPVLRRAGAHSSDAAAG
jgi:RimJ/RimL family protein N-acetyltransferase